MAEEVIQARIWTKVDTLENWNNNTLLLGPGELALVTNGQGVPMNMKWGDKTTRKRFSDLPFAIAYDQGQFVAVTSTTLPASTAGVVRYSLVGEGTYTRSGQSNVVVPAGYMGIIVDDGNTWSLGSSVALPVDPNSIKKDEVNEIGGVAGFDRFKTVEDLTTESANLSDNDFVLGAYNVSNGNNATASTVKRLPRKTITSDMVGENTIDGGGIIPSDFARVTIRASGGGTQALVIPGSGDSSPDSSDLKPLTFEITSDMVGLTIGFTAGSTSSEPAGGYENNFMWNKGVIPFPYIPKGQRVVDGSKVQNVKSPVFNSPNESTEYGVTWKAVKENAVINSDLNIEESKNKFNKNAIHSGYMNVSGTVGASANYYYTDPITVEDLSNSIFGSGTQGASNQNGFRFVTAFDATMNVLSTKGLDGGGGAANTVQQYIKDSTVKYIVATIYAVNLDTFQIEEGNSRTEYEPFGNFLVGIKDLKIKTVTDEKTGITTVYIVGDSTSSAEVDNVPLGKSWPELLRTKLEALGYAVIINGSPGATAQEINSRIGFTVPTVKFASALVANTNVTATMLDIDPVRAAYILSYNARLVSGDIIINGVFSKASASATTRRFMASSLPNNYIHDPDRIYRMYSNDSKNMVNDRTLLITGFGANNLTPTGVGNTTDLVSLKKEVVKSSSNTNCVYWGQTNRTVAEYTNVIQEMEEFCELNLGSKFIPFRKYLSSAEALKDATLYNSSFVPTSEDTVAISQNNIPPSFKTGVSSAHLNELGHWLQAQFIFNWVKEIYL